MRFEDVVRLRRSVRSFVPEPVPEERVRAWVALALMAPTVGGERDLEVVAVSRPELLEEMAERVAEETRRVLGQASPLPKGKEEEILAFSTFFSRAPLVLALGVGPYPSRMAGLGALDPQELNRRRGLPDVQSLGALVEHILLAAVADGYGGCWLSAPLIASGALEPLLKMGPGRTLMALLALGRPQRQEGLRERPDASACLRFIP